MDHDRKLQAKIVAALGQSGQDGDPEGLYVVMSGPHIAKRVIVMPHESESFQQDAEGSRISEYVEGTSWQDYTGVPRNDTPLTTAEVDSLFDRDESHGDMDHIFYLKPKPGMLAPANDENIAKAEARKAEQYESPGAINKFPEITLPE